LRDKLSRNAHAEWQAPANRRDAKEAFRRYRSLDPGRRTQGLGGFAMTYADQNEREHQALLKAIRAGKIEVYQEA
jgi:hypothetical protein